MGIRVGMEWNRLHFVRSYCSKLSGYWAEKRRLLAHDGMALDDLRMIVWRLGCLLVLVGNLTIFVLWASS